MGKSRTNLALFMMALLWLGPTGCWPGEEAVVVDFSKTVPAAKPREPESDRSVLRVAVGAMISPQETAGLYRELLNYVGRQVGYQARLIQRRTYGEINELLGRGEIDVAFICSGPYVLGRDKHGLDLLAVPVVRGQSFYHSYLIVAADGPASSLEDLKDKVFAFTDPDSNTGRLVPQDWLREMGQTPENFFRRIIYTYSHDNSILAVARGLVDGAAVDSLIWEYFHRRDPGLAARTRVIRRSEPFGIPPVVASNLLAAETRRRVREALLTMHERSDGRRILEGLMIDRFAPGQDGDYDSIRRQKERLNGRIY